MTKSAKRKQKLIVIAGPTSVGKTKLSIALAKAIRGEIISADSRQVYLGLDIGSGKVTKAETKGVPHHLLDIANPKRVFSASHFVELASIAVREISLRGHVPIVAGGTGFYIDSLLGGFALPEVPPNTNLRKQLTGKPVLWLAEKLKKMDPARFKTIDRKNPVRLIRAIEIATALGAVPLHTKEDRYDVLYLGITLPLETLRKKIHTRLLARMKEGMLAEAKRLHSKGLSFTRMEELGLEYRYLSKHLQGKLTREEMLLQLESEIVKYAKRQMTWFKKNKKIKWLSPDQSTKAISLSKKFLATSV